MRYPAIEYYREYDVFILSLSDTHYSMLKIIDAKTLVVKHTVDLPYGNFVTKISKALNYILIVGTEQLFVYKIT